MSDDAVLLRRYADERSEAAFTELVQRHLGLVYGAALRRCGGDAHRAEDVTQKVFTALARQARSLARHTVLTAWLYTTTRNIAVDLIRAEQSRVAREQEAIAMQTLLSAAAAETDWEKLRPVLDEAMDELTDADRTAVLLRYFQQLAFAEIGAALRLSEDAARMRVDRALGKLQVVLMRRGVTSTTAALAIGFANQAIVSAPAGMVASVVGAVLSESTAASAGSLLAFMSTAKMTFSLAVAAGFAIGLAVYQGKGATDAADAVTRVRSEISTQRAQLAGLEADTNAIEREVAERTMALEQGQVAAQAREQAATAAAAEQTRQAKALQQLLSSDPQMGQFRKDYDRGTWVREFMPLFLAHGLTAEQIEQAGDDYARRTALKMKGGGTTVNDLLAAVAAKTGVPADYNAWDTRILIEDLVAHLYNADTPLTIVQAERLIATVQDARSKPKDETWWGVVPMSRNVDWDRVITEAAGYLTPAQVDGLRGVAAWGRWQGQRYAAEQAGR